LTNVIFKVYQDVEYNNYNYLYIGLIFIALEIILIFSYKFLYKVNINKSLKSDKVIIKKLMDVGTFVVLSTMILLVCYVGILSLSKFEYNNTHYSNVYVSETTANIFDIDIDNLSLEKVEVIVAEGELITHSRLAAVVELDFDYTDIKNNIETILIDYDKEKVCSSRLHCSIYGPMPAIRLTFTDGQTNFTFGIDNGAEVFNGEGNVYINGSNEKGYLMFQINSGYEEEIYDIYLKVLIAYEKSKEIS